ncbi:MAG: SH3 domain-containing protein [Anaerolineaceae bacterium]|nr:SH3 domain-containing protein [Anaerolineaceae bacterium]
MGIRFIRFISVFWIVLSFSLTARAQADCSLFMEGALETAATACAGLGHNQLCFGYPPVRVVSRTDGNTFNVPSSGNRLDISTVQSLQTSLLSLSDQNWGVSIMNVQANLPSGMNATYVLFGDAEINNTGTAAQVEARIVSTNPINVRRTPSAQGAVVAVLNPDTLLIVNGRNAGDWLHLQLDDGREGWVAAYLVQTDGDLATLSRVDSETVGYALMQAFTFRTGTGDTGCAEAPQSGLLIQTPDIENSIQLQINGVDIQLSGTAFLQSEAGNSLILTVLEGMGVMHALDKSVMVPAGAASSAVIDENQQVSEAPLSPTPYNLEDLQGLPLALLPRPIEMIEPLLQREINRQMACRITATTAGTNFREGPATAYFATGTLTVNQSYRVTGRTDGLDGFNWWRVGNRRWVRSDVVTTSGNCGDVAFVDDRPTQPSTTGYSTDLTCTSERVIYAKAGDVITISDSYYSSAVQVGDIITRLYVDRDVVYEGAGAASGTGLTWTTTWVATSGIHNVQAQYTPIVFVKPDWSVDGWQPGESTSHAVCQIRVD